MTCLTKTYFRQFPSGCLTPACLPDGNLFRFRQQQQAEVLPDGKVKGA